MTIITDQMSSMAANLVLNAKLKNIIEMLNEHPPELRMGILAMAQAVSFKEVLRAHAIIDGRHKKIVMDRVMKDIEKKLRTHGWDLADTPKT